jgi:hypothetical protein
VGPRGEYPHPCEEPGHPYGARMCLARTSRAAWADGVGGGGVVRCAQVCCALSQIAKHSVDLAEVVVGAEIFPKILTCLKVQARASVRACGCTGRRSAWRACWALAGLWARPRGPLP